MQVYIVLKGTIGDYAHQLKTKATAKSPRLIKMQNEMNECVQKYSSFSCGSVKNQMVFINEFHEIAVRNNDSLTDREKTWDKYKEIEEWYESIIYQFVFSMKRKGATLEAYQRYKDKYLFGSMEDKVYFAPKIITIISSLSGTTVANYTGRTTSLYKALEEYENDPSEYVRNEKSEYSINNVVEDFEFSLNSM